MGSLLRHVKFDGYYLILVTRADVTGAASPSLPTSYLAQTARQYSTDRTSQDRHCTVMILMKLCAPCSGS